MTLSRRAALLFVLVTSSVVGVGCSFFQSQAHTNVAATCQRSCTNVAPDTQSDCQTRCMNR